MDDLYVGLDAAPPPGRPHVALGMVMAADGSIAVGGSTRRLGGPADRLAFRRLRERADVILVGAGTARAEDYGPPRVDAEGRDRRRRRGQAARPRLAVVTRSGDLDPGGRLFASEEGERPLVVTCEDAEVAHLARVAEVLAVGSRRVDLSGVLGRLRRRGVGWLLCEGGPQLNGALAAADLVDELFVTIDPVLAGEAAGLLRGPLEDAPRPLELAELHRRGDELLLRYRVSRGPHQ